MRNKFPIMLSLFITGGLLSCKPSFSPTKKYPFQTITAHGVFLVRNGNPLKKLDYIRSGDSLALHHGILIAAHYSGKFIEVEGDTTISVSLLDKNLPWHPRSKNRPSIEHLHKNKLITSSQYRPYKPLVEFPHLGFQDFIEIDTSQSFCLKWRASGGNNSTKQHKIYIQNIFSENIDSLVSNGNEITITPKKYTEITEESHIIVEVLEMDSNSGESRGFRLGSTNSIGYNMFDINEPIVALQAGYKMEYSFFYKADAEKMFELAVELSQNQAYKDLLEKFRVRQINK